MSETPATAYRNRQRELLERYLADRAENGPEAAREALIEAYLKGQQSVLGPHTDGVPLAEGFTAVRPMIERLGVREDFLDVSTDDEDAALALQATCTCRNACADAAVDEDLTILCDAYAEASRRAFPHLTVDLLLHQPQGAHTCVFRYSRPKP